MMRLWHPDVKANVIFYLISQREQPEEELEEKYAEFVTLKS